MKQNFEFPSEAARREAADSATQLTKDGKGNAVQVDVAYPTIAHINNSLSPKQFFNYVRDTPVDDIKADLRTFASEAKELRQSTQEAFKNDREWKREAEMVVTSDHAMGTIFFTLGLLPDGVTRKDIKGETPIKRKMLPLLDNDYRLRVDIEAKNLVILKCQLGLLKTAITYKEVAASGVPVDPIESSTTKLLSHMQSVVDAKEETQSKLSIVQQQRRLIEAELDAYREAHTPEVKMDDTEIKDKLHKLECDMQAGKGFPPASTEDMMELVKAMVLEMKDEMMEMKDEMMQKVAKAKDHNGRSTAQTAEEGKSIGECSEKVDETEEVHGEKSTGKKQAKGRGRKARVKKVKSSSQ